MSARPTAPANPVRDWRPLAGMLVLALWLGWTLPLLWTQSRAAAPEPGDWNATDLLAQLPQDVLTASTQQPLLLRLPDRCPCDGHDVLPTGSALQTSALALPFDWLVLHQQQLVYAGPAQLDPGCGGTGPAAARLVNHLLAQPQAAVILATPCPCLKE
ncbi:hypothetical protein [Stenotrophomonas sp.]|uniref:hypothetical protein n=1 Tax=Stenotrophomonas sp. TaxID=69392 RepID=UPI0031DB8866